MEENDFKRIEQLVSNVETRIEAKLGQLRKNVNEDFRHQVGIFTEDFQHKLQLVAEGHQMLAEKMDRMQKDIERIDGKVDGAAADLSSKIQQTDKKMDAVAVRLADSIQQVDKNLAAVAADLTSHRADTEGHKRGYQVSEP